MRIGWANQLVIGDHVLIAEVLQQMPDVFSRSVISRRVGAEMGLPAGIFNAEGDEWRKQRRMVMASFAPRNVRSYFPSLVKVSLRLRNRWRNAAREGRANQLQPDMMRFAVDAISGLAFGKDINTLDAGNDVIQNHLIRMMAAIVRRSMSLLPYWRWFNPDYASERR